METLRKEKSCFIDKCKNNAKFGTIFCALHWEKKTRREKINAIMRYEHTKGLLA